MLVGVDGSDDARRAVAWAAGTAAGLAARVVAVHAVGLLEHQRGDPDSSHLRPSLEEWTAELGSLPPEMVERRLEAGDPVSVLLRLAEAENADLVVVGTRGEGGYTATALGSTSLALAERCPRPLVIVPDPTRRAEPHPASGHPAGPASGRRPPP
jgi:nucleotide-binding universal stress UspA family protein